MRRVSINTNSYFAEEDTRVSHVPKVTQPEGQGWHPTARESRLPASAVFPGPRDRPASTGGSHGNVRDVKRYADTQGILKHPPQGFHIAPAMPPEATAVLDNPTNYQVITLFPWEFC